MKASERQKLKHDKYAETVIFGLGWARHHTVPIIICVLAVVAVAVGSAWYVYTRQRSEQMASDSLTQIHDRARTAPYLKPEEQAEMVKEVLPKYESLANTYPDSNAAPLALLQAAQLLSSTGQKAESVKFYDRALRLAGDRPGLAALAQRGMAEALEDAGKTKEALAQYQRLAVDPKSPEAIHAAWDMGRCYETLGDYVKAKEQYEKVVSAGEDNAWTNLARFRLAALAQGIPAAKPAAAAPASTVPPAAKVSVAPTTTQTPPVPATAEKVK